MKKFSIVMLLLLTSCNSFLRNADNFKLFGHDVVDEEVDQAKEKVQQTKK